MMGVKGRRSSADAAAPPHRRLHELPTAARARPRRTSRLNLPPQSGARARSATAKGPVRGRGGAHAGRSSRARSAAGFTCSPPRGLRSRPTTTPRASWFSVPRTPCEPECDLPRCRATTSNSGARRRTARSMRSAGLRPRPWPEGKTQNWAAPGGHREKCEPLLLVCSILYLGEPRSRSPKMQ